MRGLLTSAIAFAWLSAQTLTLGAQQVTEEAHFQPAEAASVHEVTEGNFSVANGTVILDVLVSEGGEVKDIQVRRDIVSLTEEAIRSIKTWTFVPAKVDGKAVTSRVTVAATFNPASVLLAADVPLPPLIHQEDEARIQSRFQPPEVTRAGFPTCPLNAIGPATVIIEATIDEAGKVQGTKALRDVPPFTASAIRRVKDWGFMPALLDGRPVEAKAILVFAFRQPIYP